MISDVNQISPRFRGIAAPLIATRFCLAFIRRVRSAPAALFVALFAALLAACTGSGGGGRPGRIDFNVHIRPILNQNCVACHGGVKSAGGISFIFRDEALRPGQSGRVAIVPRRPDQSELIARIASSDPDYRMPKPDHGAPLTPEQVALFRQWIEEGAEWKEHWAFVPPRPQTPPEVADPVWNRHAVDRFVRARLEKENLRPSPRADKATLLRRVSFDLTGLPPTPEQVALFEADTSPAAYERQVDRLLASPAYGERWASLWLDLSRYADTKGYERDNDRTAWKYRDWLIDALNKNQPYDAFMIDQLAGDLLPDATLPQRIATAFHRNTQTNDEGGTDDEEFRIAAVLDRTATTWSVLNGVTFGCVQCHDHPYDPIRHDEFYRFMAFFNTSRDADYRYEFPNLRVPDDPARYEEANALQQTLADLRRRLAATGKDAASRTKWSPAPVIAASAKPAVDFEVRDGEAFAVGTVSTQAVYDIETGLPAGFTSVTALRLEVAPIQPDRARHTPEEGFFVTRIEAAMVTSNGAEIPVNFTLFVADEEEAPLAPYRHPVNRRTRKPIVAPAALEGTVTFSANPSLFRTRWTVGVLANPGTVRPGSRLKLRLHHSRAIAERPAPVRRLRVSVSDDPQWAGLARDEEQAGLRQRIKKVEVALADIPGTDVPVMSELPADERRETRKFVRGNWTDKDGPALTPSVPAIFPPLPQGASRDRLALARWFFGPEQPLTARTAVNRYWEQLFGTGLVSTLEDYGSAGESPTHPELLDWLARRFQFDRRWDVKALLRELVLTETYRQSARADAALHQRDPQNRLLARGPRNRLTAEMVRDQALHVSGLLSSKMHGPPVMPYQPEGIWSTVYNARSWQLSEEEDRYRRALYTFWKRTSAYPSFLTFDAPTRDVCSLRRQPTNTPLQALVLMNDPVYDEAARALAVRMRRDAGEKSDVTAWISRGWQLVTGRTPDADDLAALRHLYDDALRLAIDRPAPAMEALAAVASALLNLDAALTK